MYPLTLGLIIETKTLWDDLQACLTNLPVRMVLEQTGIPDWAALIDKIDRLHPDVLFLDVTKLNEPLDEVVQRLRNRPSAPAVFALHTGADSTLILKALRSGASEYLFPPFGDHIAAALERVGAERHRKQQTTSVGGRAIGFLSVKGGCGATTVACHTAVALASRTGNKVLLADFDMDAGLVGFIMKSKSPYTIADAFRNVHRLDANYWGALVSNGFTNVEVMTSPPPPNTVEPASAEQIRYVLRFGRTQYEWVVLDLGRSLSTLTVRTLEDLDELYLVATMEIPALHQAKQIIQRLLDTGYGSNRIRLLLNRTPKRTELTLDDLQKMLGIPVFAALANDYAGLQESYAEGKLARPGSAASRSFDDLAVKIAGIDTSQRPGKKKFSLFS